MTLWVDNIPAGERATAGVSARIQAAKGNVLAALFLAALTAFAVRGMWSSLFRPWFLSSDEYVVAGEVIRFVHLTFGQHFVDMPGTPFMLIAAAIWGVSYAAGHALGFVAGPVGEFTFRHLSALFMLLRAETLFFFCLSVALLFWFTSVIANRAAAYVGALNLAMSPVYAAYSSLVRVESLAMCLMIAAFLCVMYADRRRAARLGFRVRIASEHLVFAAGIFAGLAGATRLHSITASMPVMLLLLVLRRDEPTVDEYPRWIKAVDVVAAILTLVTAAAVLFVFRPLLQTLPHAGMLVRLAFFSSAAALVVVNAMYWFHPTRRVLVRLVTPDAVCLLVGCGVGLTAGMAPVLTRFEFFLRSIEMYSGSYVDRLRVSLPFWHNLRWYVWHYLNIAAPDPIWLVLLLTGIVCALIRREQRILAMIVGAAVFFVSKPLKLIAAPHHIVLWLPFYAIVCAYPAAVGVDLIQKALRSRWIEPALTAIAVAILSISITHGPTLVASKVAPVRDRLDNVLNATDWIKRNTERDALVAISYFCFNPDVFYTWIQSLEVPVPASVLDGRRYIIWWGDKAALSGKSGYACALPRDVESMKTRIDALFPGGRTDPFTDNRFRPAQTFGTEPNQVTVFRFDYR